MLQKKHYIQSVPMLTALLASLALMGCDSDSSDDEATTETDLPELSEEVVRPVVFVHGGAGSAAQYMSQAMRFASNGYPQDYIYAFEYPGVAPHNPAELDAFINNVLAETGESQVYLVAHSMGTFVGYQGPLSQAVPNYTGYLTVPDYAAKVAKYVGLDGYPADECPGGVPCIGIFDEDDGRVLGDNTFYLEDQEHVETATSAESFELQFTFLTGQEPTTTEIVRQEGAVSISGRAAIFPANTGTDGATLQIWPVDPETGFRSTDEPAETYSIGTDGQWGPAELSPNDHYEMTLLREGHSNMHFYLQPLPRDTRFVRLHASATGSEIVSNTNTGEDHSTLVVTRQREWIANAPDGERDQLWISTVSPQWGNQSEVNAIVDGVTNNNIALHLHDDESTPAFSSLELLDWFPDQAFQSGVDVYMPASGYPDGTITLRSVPRGAEEAEQVLNVPNWPSASDRISVQFNDWW